MHAPAHGFTFVLASLFAGPIVAQVDPDLAARIQSQGLEHSGVMSFQDQLCHEIGHRLTGSDGMTRGAEWARAHFAAMGLDAKLEVWDEWKLAWNREQWMGRILTPEPIELQVATPAWTAGTQGQPKGRIVAMPKDDAAAKALVQGEGGVWLWGPRPSERSNAWSRLQPLLEQGRLLGTVQSAKSTGLTDQRYENQIRVFGDHNVAKASYASRPTIPHIIVRDDQAARIEALLAKGEVTAQFEIRNRFRDAPIAIPNVVADLVGSEKPDEMVIVCAHLDSWHQAAGATDNGTGVCSTLEAARILTAVGARPRRTIRFCLWTGEEQGLLGSQRYVVMHRAAMDKVSAVFNHDSGTNWAHTLTVADSMLADFRTAFAPVLQMKSPQAGHDGPVFVLRGQPRMAGGGGGSDHASFLAAGVPAWPWGLKGESQYGYGWHSQWDTYDIVIPAYQAHNATVFALAALGTANLSGLLSREGMGRAQPAQDARVIVEGRLGLELTDMRVTAVAKDGFAARAGVQVGDVVEEVDGKPVGSTVELWRVVRGKGESDDLTLTVVRGGKSVGLMASLKAK